MTDFTRARRRITALRLSALGIARRGGEPADVVRSLLALQAQDFAGALWSVGLRSGETRSAVTAAHESAAFVRSWPMRGTLHVIAAEDLPWMLDLTTSRAMAAAAGRHRQLGLEPADIARAERIALEALDGATATRAELLAAFEAGGLSTVGQRGAHILLRLAQLGATVLTGQDRWARLDAIVPSPRRLDRATALHELALRYFRSHGPATVADLAWWAGLTLADARAATDAARDELEELELDGRTYLMRPGLEPARPAVHLLPGFDENLLGYTDRSAPLAGAHQETIVPGSNGMFLANVVANGEIVGTWRRVESAKGVTVSQRAGADRAAARYARYLGVPLLP